MMKTRNVDEARIKQIFRISLILKAALSLVEIIGGAALLAASNETIVSIADWLTRRELLEDPRDLVANFLMQSAGHLSIDQKSAAAVYLLSHGAVKLFLVLAVLREKRWAYPLFMIALTLLIGYQTYQLSLGFSLWLAVLTIFDLVILVLAWHEYRLTRGSNAS